MSEIPKGFSGDAITPDDVQALDAALGEQPRRAAGIMTGNRVRAGWNGHATAWDWTDALAAVERIIGVAGVEVRVVADAVEPWHPGRCAAYYLGENLLGVAGEMHPKVLETLGLPPRTVAFEVVLDPLIEATEGAIYAAEAVSQQVLAKEDFAFVVADDVAAGDLVRAVRDAGGDLVESARVFDVYMGEQVGESKKSLAVNVVTRAADHTLSADEVLGVREAIIAKAEQEFGAVLR